MSQPKPRARKMGVDYRPDRKRWGYQKSYRGTRFKAYRWKTEAEAREALRELEHEIRINKQVPKNAFVKVVNDFLAYSREQERSVWRLKGLMYSFDAIIVPYFGATRSITDIESEDIERFVKEQKKRVKNSTVWHYITDLRALFNYAIHPRRRLAVKNPVKEADLSAIKARKFVKPPLSPADVEKAATVLLFKDRIYFDFLRFTGARKDEGNRTEWAHLGLDDPDNAFYVVPGTKTDESAAVLPLPAKLARDLIQWRAVCPSDKWVFPSCTKKSKNYGGKMYHRRRMFETIKKKTGIELKPKDLRDYFCNEVATRVDNPVVLMQLMRHKSLATTTKYTRTVLDRMREAVQNLGVTSGGKNDSSPSYKMPQNSPSQE